MTRNLLGTLTAYVGQLKGDMPTLLVNRIDDLSQSGHQPVMVYPSLSSDGLASGKNIYVAGNDESHFTLLRIAVIVYKENHRS